MVPLGEVAKVVSGATPKTGVSAYWGGQIAWATPADLGRLDGAYIARTPRTLTEAGLRSCTATVLPTESVLLSSRAPIGHVALNAVPMATNQGFKSLVPQAGLNPKYLFYWLRAHTDYLQSLGNGATFKELSKKTVEQIEIPLPSVEEQRRIAAILDKADAIRAKRRQVLAHLDALTQSIFHDMFSHVDLSSRQVSELAAVWDCPHSTPRWTDSGFVCVRTPNLIAGDWDWSDRRFVDDGQFKARTRGGGARPGDIILSREGTVGVAAIVQPGMEICMGQRLVQLRPNLDLVRSEYLLAYLLRALRPERIQQLMVGSTAQHLNVRDLRGLPVPVAPMDLQREFVSRTHRIGTQRVAARSAAGESERLFASLQSRAFIGEL
jgi:type I restriction enzyme S subunit